MTPGRPASFYRRFPARKYFAYRFQHGDRGGCAYAARARVKRTSPTIHSRCGAVRGEFRDRKERDITWHGA